MWKVLTVSVSGLVIGLAVGLGVDIHLPAQYASYLSVSILAAFDTVFGGLRAALQKSFEPRTFLTGFFANTLLAGLLAFIGTELGVDLALAAVVAFGVRIFNNLAQIRHILLSSK